MLYCVWGAQGERDTGRQRKREKRKLPSTIVAPNVSFHFCHFASFRSKSKSLRIAMKPQSLKLSFQCDIFVKLHSTLHASRGFHTICFISGITTAWDSEIESLTSLIKLHQNERRSAPCGQIGAATQPPELATSPTLKKFWVARAFEVRWACTCCHDRTGFNCCLLPLSHFSLFFVSLGALHNPERSLNSRV